MAHDHDRTLGPFAVHGDAWAGPQSADSRRLQGWWRRGAVHAGSVPGAKRMQVQYFSGSWIDLSKHIKLGCVHLRLQCFEGEPSIFFGTVHLLSRPPLCLCSGHRPLPCCGHTRVSPAVVAELGRNIAWPRQPPPPPPPLGSSTSTMSFGHGALTLTLPRRLHRC